MPLPNEEFGRAVRDAIEWMGCTPESAGATLGIKTQTLNAMCSGIVPMRSLVIRFASEIAQRCSTTFNSTNTTAASSGSAGITPQRRRWPPPRRGPQSVSQLPGPLSPRNRGRVPNLSASHRGHGVHHEPGLHTAHRQ